MAAGHGAHDRRELSGYHVHLLLLLNPIIYGNCRFYLLLGLTSVAGLAVVLWRAWMLRWSKVVPPRIAEALAECRTPDDVPKLRAACENHPSPLGRLLLFAADHLDWPKAENVSSLETAARREIVRLERGLVVLEIIIGIAPLLGLVGTIIGMMTVFNDIGEAGLNNASRLAQGISVILKSDADRPAHRHSGAGRLGLFQQESRGVRRGNGNAVR